MKKCSVFFLLMLIFSYQGFSQCMMYPVSFTQKILAADAIIEGKVISKTSYWNTTHTFIFTSNIIDVYKVFKGTITAAQLELITEGGVVEGTKITAEPLLTLEENQSGILFLTTCVNSNPHSAFYPALQFESYASNQGFIIYDLKNKTAADPFTIYSNIENAIYKPLAKQLNCSFTEVSLFDINATQNRIQPTVLIAPAITSINPSTSTAGTFSLVTIAGSNFGNGPFASPRNLEWRDANNGGAGFITTPANHIISWSSTAIQAWIPTGAGSGTIRVTNDLNEVTVSGVSVTVNYNESNVNSGGVYYQPDLINQNGIGGYTYKYNTTFNGNASAFQAFERALQTWRCNTFVNFAHSATSAITCQALDGTNLVTFDGACALPAGVLGVSYSYYSSCASGVWYLNENDLKFRTDATGGINWNFGPAATSGGLYDFESVCLHELGHSHQLGHTILPITVMNYAVGPNTDRRTLTASSELAGGNDILSRSIVNNSCGSTGMILLNGTNCAIAAPVANFSGSPLTGCNSLNVTFTDLSVNTPASWTWSFPGGVPNTFSGQTPPVINYAAPGNYTVTLSVSNAFGTDGETKTNYITVNNCPPPVADFYGNPTSLCEGQQVSFFDLSTNSPTIWSWSFPGGTPAVSSAQYPVITYSTSGSYNVTLTASNPYGSNPITKNLYITVNVCPPAPVTNFTGTPTTICAGATVNFTDLSTNTPTSWQWTFGGGTPATSIAKNPAVTYSTAGTYSVTLTATNSGGSNAFTRTSYITVNVCSKPTINFAAFPRSVCEGQTVSFSDLSGNTPTSWTWTFTGGTPATSNAQNPVITYNVAGSYAVKLKAGNGFGNDSLTQTNFIVVSTCPPAGSGLVVNDGALIYAQATALITVQGGVINQDNGANIGEWDNKGLLTFTGDWTNNSTGNVFINASTGTSQLLGANQLIAGTAPTYFYNLTLSGTGLKTQSVDARVLGTLALNDRELNTQGKIMYVINAAAGAISRTGGFNSTPIQGFVSSTGNGRLWRATNSTNTYLFPVGSSIGTARYRPIEITPTSSSATVFSSRFVNGDPSIDGFDRTLKDVTLGNVNAAWYQKIDRVSGSTTAQIKIYADNVLDGVSSFTTLQMTQWGYTTPPVTWKHITGNSGTTATSPALGSVAKTAYNSFTTENFNIAPESVPLPVELVSFTSVCNDKRQIVLNWITASEFNNDYFIVEKSTDVQSFALLAKINGAGNSSDINLYSFTDEIKNSNINYYYRLSQFDFNGSQKLLGVIANSCADHHDGANLISLYPNPVFQNLLIDLNLYTDAAMHLMITDMEGREILARNYDFKTGLHTLQLDLSQLAAGAYQIVFNDGISQDVRKVFKIK